MWNSAIRSSLSAATPRGLGQPGEARRQHRAIAGGQAGAALLVQPGLHVAQAVQHGGQPPRHAVAGAAEPGVEGPAGLLARLLQGPARLPQDVLLLRAARCGAEQIDHAVELGSGQLVAVERGQDLGLVAGRQPHQRPRGGGREQPEAEVIAGGVGQLLDQGQPAADPALVPAQQLGDLDLGQAVLADQGMNDPGVFPFLGAAAGLVEAVDGGLGGALVRL